MSKYDPVDGRGIWRIHRACLESEDAVREALSGMLSTCDDNADSGEARGVLKRAQTAIQDLLSHLDSSYEFGSTSEGEGTADVAEGVCNLD